MCEIMSAVIMKPVEADLHRVREDTRTPAVQSELGLPSRAIAAGAAAFVSAIVVNPLDIVKTRLQVQAMFSSLPEPTLSFSGACPRACPRLSGGQLACSPACYVYSDSWDAMKKIARQEGLHRLWKGTGSALLMAVPTVGIYLPAYEALYGHLSSPAMPGAVQAGAALLSGAASRTLAVLACAPLEFTRTRIQAVPGEAGVLAVMRSIMGVDLSATNANQGSGVGSNITSSSSSNSSTATSRNALAAASNRAMPGAAPVATSAPGGVAPSLWSRVRIMYTGAGTQLARDVPFSAIYWATLEPTRRFLTAEDGPLHALLGRRSPPSARVCTAVPAATSTTEGAGSPSSGSSRQRGGTIEGAGVTESGAASTQGGAGIVDELLETGSGHRMDGRDDVASAMERSKRGAVIAASDRIGVASTDIQCVIDSSSSPGHVISSNRGSSAPTSGSISMTTEQEPRFYTKSSVGGASTTGVGVTGVTGGAGGGGGLSPSQADKDRVMVAGSIISGCLSGGFAAALTTPLDVIKTTRQVEVDPMQPRGMGTLAMMAKIARERGLRVLFSGVTARVARVAPSCAIVLAAYEASKVLLLKAA
eukprot:jgi/Mesvir1/25951/Mv20943-RA.1